MLMRVCVFLTIFEIKCLMYLFYLALHLFLITFVLFLIGINCTEELINMVTFNKNLLLLFVSNILILHFLLKYLITIDVILLQSENSHD